LEGVKLAWLHIMVFAPFVAALLVPSLYKQLNRIHTGWFVLGVPVLIFLYFLTYTSAISQGNAFISTVAWLPSLGIDLVF